MSYEIPNAQSHLQVWSIDADHIQQLEEKVEFLREKIENLELDLFHKNYELQHIKQELCAALSSKPLTIDEAIELTKNVLASDKLNENMLVELLIAINSSW